MCDAVFAVAVAGPVRGVRAGAIGPVRREIVFEPLHERPVPATQEPQPKDPETVPKDPVPSGS